MRSQILKYIFSFTILIFSFLSVLGQEDSLFALTKEKEPLKFLGLKLGVNAGRFTDFQFKPERFSYEGSIDINFSNKYFGVIEAGYSEIDLEKDNYNYFSKGTFYKIGMDYNMLKKVPSDYLGVGFRIGRSDFSQSAKNVIIEDAHWPSFTTIIDSKQYKSYWCEFALGIKGELLKNVYFGWSAMVKIRVSGGNDEAFMPYDIPGFGKGSSSVHLGANYYIYYQIPFNRK